MTFKAILGTVIWATASLCALFYIAQIRVTNFDPQHTLLTASMSEDFDSEVKAFFSNTQGSLKGAVFHIGDDSCNCNKLSQSHIRKLNGTFTEYGFNVHTISPQNTEGLNTLIPSYPAVVIFDETGNLGYLGPYSTGYLCSSRTSLIEPIAKTIVSNAHMGATIIADGEGCYCKS